MKDLLSKRDAIFIHKEIMFSKDLTPNEKTIYSIIHNTNKEINYNGVTFTNKEISNLLNISIRSVSRIISSLVDKGYIERLMIYNDKKEVVKRILIPLKYID